VDYGTLDVTKALMSEAACNRSAAFCRRASRAVESITPMGLPGADTRSAYSLRDRRQVSSGLSMRALRPEELNLCARRQASNLDMEAHLILLHKWEKT
jgi:hypothetical protein